MCVKEQINYLNEIVENIPYKYTDHWDSFEPNATTEAFKLRKQWIKKGMFALVTWSWVTPFAKWIGNKKCLEVMAGRGWLSLALHSLGVDITATDDYSWSKERKWDEPVTEVEELDAIKAVEKYGKDIDLLIISWPYMDDNAYKTITALHKINPNALIVYIGEGCGGCTADDDFHDHFREIEDEEFQKAASGFQRWWGLHDYVMLGEYI
jgi:hypothetical protein